jgi:hypothetical protein
MACTGIQQYRAKRMTINYPLHVQERFTRLLKQRADQAKKAKGAKIAGMDQAEARRKRSFILSGRHKPDTGNVLSGLAVGAA